MQSIKSFIDWLKDPKPLDDKPFNCSKCNDKIKEPVLCDKCKKKKKEDDERSERRRRDDDDDAMFAAIAGAIS